MRRQSPRRRARSANGVSTARAGAAARARTAAGRAASTTGAGSNPGSGRRSSSRTNLRRASIRSNAAGWRSRSSARRAASAKTIPSSQFSAHPRRQRRRDDVDLEGHAGGDRLRRAGPDGRVDPLVVAGQVPGIERRTQAAAGERRRHRVENGAAGHADVGRVVPGGEPVEIGGRGLQERLVVLRREAGPGGEPAPDSRSPR